MKSAVPDETNGSSAKDKMALLKYEQEIEEKKSKEIERINKAANTAQYRDAAALKVSKIDFSQNHAVVGAKVRKVLTSLPEMPATWDEEKQLVCGLLFADFSSGKLQYHTYKPIEVSAAIRPMKMLKLLIHAQPKTVTYEEFAKEFGLLTQIEKEKKKVGKVEFDVPAHQRHGRQIQDVRGDLDALLRKAGMNNTEIAKMIITKPKQGFALRCGN